MDSGWVRDHAVTQIVRATIFNKLIFYARPRSQLSIQRRYAQQMFDPGAQGPASAAAHAAAPTSSASCTPPKEELHRLVALKKHEFQAVEYIREISCRAVCNSLHHSDVLSLFEPEHGSFKFVLRIRCKWNSSCGKMLTKI